MNKVEVLEYMVDRLKENYIENESKKVGLRGWEYTGYREKVKRDGDICLGLALIAVDKEEEPWIN